MKLELSVKKILKITMTKSKKIETEIKKKWKMESRSWRSKKKGREKIKRRK